MKFHFEDNVKVIGGFYKGQLGKVTDIIPGWAYHTFWGGEKTYPTQYYITIPGSLGIIKVLEEDLELNK